MITGNVMMSGPSFPRSDRIEATQLFVVRLSYLNYDRSGTDNQCMMEADDEGSQCASYIEGLI